MNLVKELSEIFNIIEPWLVFLTFIFQFFIYSVFLRRRIKRQLLSEDILNNVLSQVKVWTDGFGKPKKKKNVMEVHNGQRNTRDTKEN